ncbi:hypothetical protein Agub_g6271, partial [Astrephomene gubernaculifera]
GEGKVTAAEAQPAAAALKPGPRSSGGAGSGSSSRSSPLPPAAAAEVAAAAAPAPASSTSGSGLRLVLSPGPTPAAALLVPRRLAGLSKEEAEGVKELEICAVGMATAERLSQRLGRQGGAALLVDYGREGPPYGDSLMGIRAHRGVGILDAPGTADLSAWVDFGALRLAAAGSGAPVATAGPVSQAAFLRALGIGARLQALLGGRGVSEAAAAALVSGCERLVDEGPEGMGRTYQVMAI